MSPERGAERPHTPSTSERWEESWEFEFVAPDGELGGFVRLARWPNQRRIWCWVYVLRDDGTVVVRDHDVPLSSTHPLLARAEGLWCELVCETQLEHWSIGVEAFGVRLDDPSDGLRGEIGERLPVGMELEWEGEAVEAHDALCAPGATGYEQRGRVHGDVLLGAEVVPFDGFGLRRHTWGDRDWSQTVDNLWCAWPEGTWLLDCGRVPDPFVARPMFDAVVPLTAHGAVLTRSLVAVVDDRGSIGYGMRTVVSGPPD